MNYALQNKKGFTLIETIVGIAVFLIIAISIYQSFIAAMRLSQVANLMVASTALANERFEIVHNLTYSDIGTITGIPVGKISSSTNIIKNQNNFLVETTVRNIDDPFDGVLGGSPSDTSPADYKLVELKISVPGNSRFQPISYTKIFAPRSLEGSSVNGALFIKVFDANGQSVYGANVHIENGLIVIDDVTNIHGELQIIDAPPGNEAYKITVNKDGYSEEKTYPSGDIDNPNPAKLHATVLAHAITQISFAIDQISTVNVESVSETCVPIGNVDFNLRGAKKIGSEPDVLKYPDTLFSTDGSGQKTINDLEWDTYTLTLVDSVYDLTGSISIIPFNLNPGSTQEVKIVTALKEPQSLLIRVKEGGTDLPLSGVDLKLENGIFLKELVTGRGSLRQTDWSGGSGQSNYTDVSKYYSSNNNLDETIVPGEVSLKKIFENYADSGTLISSAFDTGSISNFYQLDFSPKDQPPETGADSVKIQISTNNDNETWDYKGPDGTNSTFYTKNNLNINSVHNGDRYFRYQLFLQTASSTLTPNAAEVSFTFSSLCVPSGQAIFKNLTPATYVFTASKTGYQTIVENINISSPWQQYETTLMPE